MWVFVRPQAPYYKPQLPLHPWLLRCQGVSSTGHTHRFQTIFKFLEPGSVSTQRMSDSPRGQMHSFLYRFSVLGDWQCLQRADKWPAARWMRLTSYMASVQDGSESSCQTPLDFQSQHHGTARSLRGHGSRP